MTSADDSADDRSEPDPRVVAAQTAERIEHAPTPEPPVPAAVEAVTKPASRAGRNLPAAIGVGVGLAVVVVGSLVLYKPVFALLVAAAITLATHELVSALGHRGATIDPTVTPTRAETRIPRAPAYLGAVVMLAAAYFGGLGAMLLAFAATVMAIFVWRMRKGSDGFVRDVTAGVFAAAYVPFFAGFAILMVRPHDGVLRVLCFVAVAVASDVGGYAAGASIGKHPMAPRISPKKSWEGFGGSVVACLVVGWAMVTFVLGGPWWVGFLLGAVGVGFATLGDLGESMIKRDLGIKDMSNLLPGHGGMMDRLDSLLFFAPVAWAVLYFLVR